MKSLLFTTVFLFFCIFTASSQVQAQCATGTVYGTSFVWQSGNGVYGYAASELDYCAGLYGDPAVWSRFTEGNWATEIVRPIKHLRKSNQVF